MEALRLQISKKPHALLRGEMQKYGITGRFLSAILGITPPTFSRKMTGKAPWSSFEMYKIMECIDQPINRLHELFPDYRGKRK